MTLDEITRKAINPALAMLPKGMDSPEARVLLLAIGLQESQFKFRRQLVGSPPRPTGPAKSFWQGEIGGGMVHGVRVHAESAKHAAKLYAARGVEAADRAIWNAIENDDVLAAGLARLLTYTDPFSLPKLGDSEAAWRLYAERCWRPGKPHKATWAGYYKQALEYVTK